MGYVRSVTIIQRSIGLSGIIVLVRITIHYGEIQAEGPFFVCLFLFKKM